MKMQQMKHQLESISFTAAAGGGVLTAFMDFFNTNAAGIGAICTVVSCLVYVIVSVRNSNNKEKRDGT